MKFMKLGSKPDAFQTDGSNARYVATELASDIVVSIGDQKFHLHKFPLLSKSAHLQKLVTSMSVGSGDEIHIDDIPGGAVAFEICAKFCYAMTVTLNAYNVVAARCAAEYLEMHEMMEKGNLIYKIDVFLSSSIFRSWKDSVIVLQTTKSLSPWPEELKLVNHCIEAIASKASVDTSRVDWSYSYNRKKLPEENGNDPNWNSLRKIVPNDWWVEDLAELELDLYKRVVCQMKNRGTIQSEVIGEALQAYALRRLPGFGKGIIQSADISKTRSLVDMMLWLLPEEKGSISCSFMLKLLKVAILVDSEEPAKNKLIKRIGQQLEEASVNDLLIHSSEGETLKYNVDVVQKIVEEFMNQDQNSEVLEGEENGEIQEIRKQGGILNEASKLMVGKLVDGLLAEISTDPNLPLLRFVGLAGLVSGISRPSHDGLYRAIDTYLKEHPGITKSEKKKICKLMDCKKLSVNACAHAVQNERLPLRVVVQVLFFEQVRATASSGSSTPDLPKGLRDLAVCSHGSSRSVTTNAVDDDWDAVATSEELRVLRAEVAALRVGNSGGDRGGAAANNVGRMKGLLMTKKIFSKIWSNKAAARGETSGSDSSEGQSSANFEEAKSTPSRNRRYSVS